MAESTVEMVKRATDRPTEAAERTLITHMYVCSNNNLFVTHINIPTTPSIPNPIHSSVNLSYLRAVKIVISSKTNIYHTSIQCFRIF